MSGGIIGATSLSGFGISSRLVGDSAQVRARMDTLLRQASTGRAGDTYAQLGNASSASLSLRPSLARLETYQANIDAAAGRMELTQSTLKQISDIASRFRAQTINLNGLSQSEVDTIAGSARDALKQVSGLLNSRDGSVYIFAGQDGATAPVPSGDNINTSGFAAAIGSALAGLATAGGPATIAATLAIATSNVAGISAFSTSLSQTASALAGQRTSVRAGDSVSVPTGILASINADVGSSGAATTGSYMRDILRGLATLGALSGSQVTAAGFGDVVADIRTSLADAGSALASDAGVLGDRQAGLATTKATLANMATALLGQISDAEDVDMAKTLSRLSAVQFQLQASYQLIASLQNMSLIKYLAG
jgi:flagellar hook-associated protein 3 FlgL